jgi:hypothetical protein
LLSPLPYLYRVFYRQKVTTRPAKNRKILLFSSAAYKNITQPAFCGETTSLSDMNRRISASDELVVGFRDKGDIEMSSNVYIFSKLKNYSSFV